MAESEAVEETATVASHITLYVHVKPSDKVFLLRVKSNATFPQLQNEIIRHFAKVYPHESKLFVRRMCLMSMKYVQYHTKLTI